MKKILKTLVLMACVLSVSWASVLVIFAKNTTVAAEEDLLTNVSKSVNPYLAVLAAVIVCIIGIIVFIKRNKESD